MNRTSTILVLLLLALSACRDKDDEETLRTDAAAGGYSIALTVATTAALPRCNSALWGTTAYVRAPSSLYSCLGSAWVPLPCTNALGGVVAYATGERFLLACSGGNWTQVALPAGTPGPRGDTGPAGPQGPMGPAGPSGANGLVSASVEPTGAHCPAGGVRLDSGSDSNANGALEASEVRATSYVCNGNSGAMGAQGATGAAGPTSLVAATPEAPGASCAAGGTRLTVGVDVNRNGALDSSEVSSISYVCHGQTAEPSASDAGAEPADTGSADAGAPGDGDGSDVGDDDGGPSLAIALTPDLVSVAVGESTVLPSPLLLTLNPAPSVDTFIPIAVSDPSALTIAGGGVTMPAGQTSTQVVVQGVAGSPAVTVTASLAGQSGQSSVSVFDRGAGQPARLRALTPTRSTGTRFGSAPLTVVLDAPAGPGGSEVSLSALPGSAILPTSVIVPENALSVSFVCTDIEFDVEVTASLDGANVTALIVVPDLHLMINEVDYNSVGVDSSEFVELYNPTASDVPTGSYAIVYVTAAGEYARTALGPIIPTHGYLVVAGPTLSLRTGTPTVQIASNTILNSSPGGVALVDLQTRSIVDSISFGGAIPGAVIGGVDGAQPITEGSELPVGMIDSNTLTRSLCRQPNGSDSDDNSADYGACSMPTPGTANAP